MHRKQVGRQSMCIKLKRDDCLFIQFKLHISSDLKVEKDKVNFFFILKSHLD
jgi:hypothetical protein